MHEASDKHLDDLASRIIAFVLSVVIVILLIADVVVPDSQFTLDVPALSLAFAAMLVLLNKKLPWNGGGPQGPSGT